MALALLVFFLQGDAVHGADAQLLGLAWGAARGDHLRPRRAVEQGLRQRRDLAVAGAHGLAFGLDPLLPLLLLLLNLVVLEDRRQDVLPPSRDNEDADEERQKQLGHGPREERHLFRDAGDRYIEGLLPREADEDAQRLHHLPNGVVHGILRDIQLGDLDEAEDHREGGAGDQQRPHDLLHHALLVAEEMPAQPPISGEEEKPCHDHRHHVPELLREAPGARLDVHVAQHLEEREHKAAADEHRHLQVAVRRHGALGLVPFRIRHDAADDEAHRLRHHEGDSEADHVIFRLLCLLDPLLLRLVHLVVA
mmetsp:Transcript_54125/g.139405  ORF Transcript_54125/g.139405 Transcript_54125/m.139405 type:complete len:308 (-) Transcript_54125:684-1607(-)